LRSREGSLRDRDVVLGPHWHASARTDSSVFPPNRRGTNRANAAAMLKVDRSFLLLSFVALVACGGSTEGVPRASETTTPGTNETETEITNPETGMKVRATIAAASLGSGSSNVQMAFFASDATAPAPISISKVLLLDAKTGQTVDTLEASAPSVWNGRSYEKWNESVTPGGDLRASYQLTTPDWSTIDADAKRTTNISSYSTPYKLRVTLRIDGVEVTIESGELQREPEVAT
jgi:hypothetical protein